jgi:hypothetical protein
MLIELYDHTYVAPKFVPSAAIVRLSYEMSYLMDAAEAGDQDKLKQLRMGNTGLAQLGIVMDGFVTNGGSIVSRDVFLPCAIVVDGVPLSGRDAGFNSTFEARQQTWLHILAQHLD